MSDSSGCKILVTALVVGLVMGVLGFGAGFLTHAVLVADPPGEASALIVEVTAVPAQEEPTLAPEAVTVEVAPETGSGTEEAVQAPATEPAAEPTAAPAPTIEIPPESGTTFDLFWEAWQLIQRDYYGDLPTEEEMTYGAIRGAVNTLGDPFTAFIEPDAAEINRQDDSGSFEGIGAYVTMQDGRLMIVSTFEGQPAEQVGLRRNDIVLQVDDTVIENMSIYEAIDLIRGPAGTTVTLTILREGEEPFEVEVTRASIDIPVVESEMREDGIAYVRLIDFSSDAAAKLEAAVEEMLAQNPTGLILDLRSNPGGWLNEAVLVSGLFLPEDELVLIERFRDGTERPYYSPNQPVNLDLPMVLLVDGGSASASEIVAGALQDHGRATLIGETTFGKGSVQWPHELSNGAELRVTVARWFTPADRAIHGEGLEPDITVELTVEDMDAGLDPQLDRAVEYLLAGE
ncbi:MAG: S41 family peptidase [Anaerolineae bacterium]|jgi:carboxyl-terminal processing protease